MSLIPVTIITGFLGAGKTTLLNRILRDKEIKERVAIIENEFGEENIDSGLLVQEDAEEIIQMSNGCICCSIRSDLVTALSSLAKRHRQGDLVFDKVIIETTGLADPEPVVQTFFLDDSVAESYMIDGVITLIDAVYAMQQLDEYEQARQQVGFADKLLISKTDLVSHEEVESLMTRLRRINPHAAIHIVDYGKCDINAVLDLKGFNLTSQLDLDHEDEHHHHHHDEGCTCGHDHHHHDHECTCGCHDHEHDHDCNCEHHHHLDDINSFVFRSDKPFDAEQLNNFFADMIENFGMDMLRYKGVVNVKGADNKVVFQGVKQLVGSDLAEPWPENMPRESKMVFIGKKLPQDIFMQGLSKCLVEN